MKLHVDIEKDLHSFRLKVSFDTDGEVFAVLGSSGSGKSMTLKCIAGIEKPDRGVVTLGGRVLFDSAAGIDLPPQKRRIGYLFQDHALFPHMTVMENISCGSEKNAREYIDRFYLRGKEDLRPHQLSGGEKQRTAIARMLAAEPKLIMLDEPLSALDSYLKSGMEEELVRAIGQCGDQALLVSHDREEIYRLSDRIAVLEEGRLTCIQEKKELFAYPASLAAARLTGCENISALHDDGSGSLLAEAWGVQIPYAAAGPDGADGIDTDGKVPDRCRRRPGHVAFRARDVRIVNEDEREGKNRDLDGMILLCPVEPEKIRVIDDLNGMTAKGKTRGGQSICCALQPDMAGMIYDRQCMYFAIPYDKLMFFDR